MNKENYESFSNLLLNNKVSFTNKWDMEQCDSTYEIKNWRKTPNGDPEWTYMLNRLEFLNKLIISFEMTGKIEYIEKYYSIVDDWNSNVYRYITKKNIYHNHTGVLLKIKKKCIDEYKKVRKNHRCFINPIRSLDTAIRCFSLTNDILYLDKLKLLTKERRENLKSKIISQIEFLKENYIETYNESNWGVLQVIYSLYCLIVFELQESNIYQWNFNKLNNLLEKQISNEGSHIEDTPLYHIQIFIGLSHLISIMQKNNIKVSCNLLEKYKKMADYIYNTCTPQNLSINFGDSDSTNISDIMYVAFLILNEKKYLERVNTEIDLQFISRFTLSSKLKYVNISSSKMEDKELIFYDSKKVVLNKNKNFIMVSNNDNITSHRHVDLGSFVYYFNNQPFLVDSGRLTYKFCKNRKYLKSQFAHNTLFIDKNKMAKILTSWSYKKNIKASKIELLDNDVIICTIEEDNIIYKRFFIILEKGLVIINKIINNIDKRNHMSNRNYILDSLITINQKDCYELSNNDKKIFLYTSAKYSKIQETIISKRYNKLEKSKKILLKNDFKQKSISFDCFFQEKCDIKFEESKCIINNRNVIILEDDVIKISKG